MDQPEDDIDNKVIYDEIVGSLQRGKRCRQIIVSTHQANVPVLGDADKIIVLASDGRYGSLKEDGGIEEDSITAEVLNILEGSPEAFRKRQMKYGLEARHLSS